MKGNNEIILNTATMMSIVQEYVDKYGTGELSGDVIGFEPVKDSTYSGQTYRVTLQEKGTAQS